MEHRKNQASRNGERLAQITTFVWLAVAGCTGDAGATGGTGDGGTATAGKVTGGSMGTTDGQGSAGSAGFGTGGSGDLTGSTFIVDPTGGGGALECDVWGQDCPPGEKCMPWANDGGNAWNALKCVPVDENPKPPGDDCMVEGGGVSGVDDYDVGSMCWNVDFETNQGYCVTFCEGSPDAPTCQDPDASCVVANDGVLILCLPACDPLIQDWRDREVCIPNTSADGFVCVLDASGGMGTAGAPCEFANACSAGLLCVNAEFIPGCMGALGCCGTFCDLNDPGASTTCNNAYDLPGADCVPFFDMGTAPPGHEDVGGCIVPQ